MWCGLVLVYEMSCSESVCVIWCGVVWCGVAWCGVVIGVARGGVVQLLRSVVLCGVHGKVWCKRASAWSGVVCLGVLCVRGC